MFLEKGFFKNLFKVGGATIFAQSIGIISVPIFARLFLPEVLGQFTLLISVVSIFGLFSTMRYEMALMLPKDDIASINIIIGTVIISTIWTFFIYFIIYFLEDTILNLGSLGSISTFLYLIPILVYIASLINILRFWANRKKMFGFNAKLTLLNSFTIKSSNISLGYMGYITAIPLVLSYFIFQTLEVLIRLHNFIKANFNTISTKCTFISIREQLIRYKRFPLIDVWNGFMDTGSLLIVPIILSVFFTHNVVGLYSQSLNIVQLPIALIANAFGQVFFQRLSDAKHNNELSQIISESFVLLLMISIPIFSILLIWGPSLFNFFLGSVWIESGKYASYLAPWCMLKLVYSPLSATFIVTERQDLFLALTISTIITRVLSILVGGVFNNPDIAIKLFGISGFITLSFGLLLIFYLAKVKPQHIKFAVINNFFISKVLKLL